VQNDSALTNASRVYTTESLEESLNKLTTRQRREPPCLRHGECTPRHAGRHTLTHNALTSNQAWMGSIGQSMTWIVLPQSVAKTRMAAFA
jgi:hypothetical protein